MPLNGDIIYNRVKSRVSARFESVVSGGQKVFEWDDDSVMDEILKAICQEIVDAIHNEAVVNVISVSGVKTGPSASGPGTGTIS